MIFCLNVELYQYINIQLQTGKMSGSSSNLLYLKSKFGSCLGLKCESKPETNGKIKFLIKIMIRINFACFNLYNHY